MSITIDKDVPLPLKRGKEGGSLRLTIKALEVGHSIVLPDSVSRRSNCYMLAGRLGYKITCRANEDGTFRMWRTA